MIKMKCIDQNLDSENSVISQASPFQVSYDTSIRCNKKNLIYTLLWKRISTIINSSQCKHNTYFFNIITLDDSLWFWPCVCNHCSLFLAPTVSGFIIQICPVDSVVTISILCWHNAWLKWLKPHWMVQIETSVPLQLSLGEMVSASFSWIELHWQPVPK